MVNLIALVFALAALFVALSFLAAEKASGHMPFSGYDEERRWGRISMILLFIGFGFGGIGLYLHG
jgi:hypothetical protein